MADTAPPSVEAEKNQIKLTQKNKITWLSPIPTLTFFLAIFYGEGRAYRLGYLEYLGLDDSQFPVSTTDAYWLAFNGWAIIAGNGASTIFDHYSIYIKSLWLTVLVGILAAALGIYGRRQQWHIGFSDWWNQRLTKAKTAANPIVASAGLSLLTMAGIPFILMILTVLLATFMLVFVLPFFQLGRWEARSECEFEAARKPLVQYVGDERASVDGKSVPTARLIQCSTDFCALIRDGEAFVIPRLSVRWAGGVPIEPSVPKHGKERIIPVESRLCYKPEVITAPHPNEAKLPVAGEHIETKDKQNQSS